jgi:hypothetical protein
LGRYLKSGLVTAALASILMIDIAASPARAQHYPVENPGPGNGIVDSATNMNSSANDPYFNFSSTRDSGASVKTPSGAAAGTTPSSRITDIGGGVDGHFNASKFFDITADQRLTIGAFFDYDSERINYNSPALTAPSANRNIYSFGSMFRYTSAALISAPAPAASLATAV